MILTHIKSVSGSATGQPEKLEAELQDQLMPENFTDKLDALGAESMSLLCNQIVSSRKLGLQKLETALEEPFPLGYLTGFSMGFLESTGHTDERLKILVLQTAIDMVFGDEGKRNFTKVGEYLSTGQEKFREGLRDGFQDAVGRVEQEKEPLGLKSYLMNS